MIENLTLFFFGSLVINVLIGFFIMVDLKRRYPEMYKKFGGTKFLNPFKRLDFSIFIFRRGYAEGNLAKFHPYDLFLITFVASILLFLLLMFLS